MYICVSFSKKNLPKQVDFVPDFLYVSLMDAFNPPNLLSCVIGSKKSVLGIFLKFRPFLQLLEHLQGQKSSYFHPIST